MKMDIAMKLGYMKYVARKAGEIIMDLRDKDLDIHYKQDGGTVTKADLRVKDFVLESLAKEFPDCGLLTEESEDSKERLGKKGVFIVDEIDGTRSFAGKRDDFSFLCAYIEEGKPVAGVMNEPHNDRMVFAQKGHMPQVIQGGCTRELEPLQPVKWDEFKVGYPYNYHGVKYNDMYAALGITKERKVPYESMGTRMMHIALQDVHSIFGLTRNLKEWDIAAGHAILESMGVSITDIKGNPLVYNKKRPNTNQGILVLHPDIKDTALEIVADFYHKIDW
ncbi:inositol monophosphatase family protein [Thermoproteota archaeon]